jgi:hypothetical protein
MGTQHDPELLAVKALGFLAETPDALTRFLNSTGATPSDLRDLAEDPHFLGAVLDFLLSDDELVRHFCTSESIDAQAVHRARRRLSPSQTD